jgi:hypothetical protein
VRSVISACSDRSLSSARRRAAWSAPPRRLISVISTTNATRRTRSVWLAMVNENRGGKKKKALMNADASAAARAGPMPPNHALTMTPAENSTKGL